MSTLSFEFVCTGEEALRSAAAIIDNLGALATYSYSAPGTGQNGTFTVRAGDTACMERAVECLRRHPYLRYLLPRDIESRLLLAAA